MSATSSQQFVPIKDIHEGVVILKNGQMCSILLASSMNFALKSSTEQQAILSQFQSLLNTLDFTLQIYIQSRRLDIRPYLATLEELEPNQNNDLMRIQLREYVEYIRSFTSEVDIMTKNFFVVIPYTPASANIKGITSILHTSDKKQFTIDPERFQEDRSQLEQRMAVVEQGLARIGIRSVPLGNEELIELFYHIFNPEDMSRAPKI